MYNDIEKRVHDFERECIVEWRELEGEENNDIILF